MDQQNSQKFFLLDEEIGQFLYWLWRRDWRRGRTWLKSTLFPTSNYPFIPGIYHSFEHLTPLSVFFLFLITTLFLRLGNRSLEGMAHAPVHNVPQTGCSVGSFCCYSCWPLGVINYHLDPFLNRGTPCILGWVLANLWAQRSDYLAKENEFHYLLAKGRFLKRWAGIKYRRKGVWQLFILTSHGLETCVSWGSHPRHC